MSERPDILREYRVSITPSDGSTPHPRSSDNLGLRTKLGGLPDGIQSDDEMEIRCPQCFARMTFIAQIDSFEYNGRTNPNRKSYGDEQFMFGDVGMIYIWFCFSCQQPHATMECH